jgi:hypothetical protein
MNIKRGYEDIKHCHFVACLHSVNDRRLGDNFSIGLPIAFFRVDLTESVSNVPMCFMKPVEFTDHERHNMCLHRGVIQHADWIKGASHKLYINSILACDEILPSRYVIGWTNEGRNEECYFIPLCQMFDFGDSVLSHYKKRFSRKEFEFAEDHENASEEDPNSLWIPLDNDDGEEEQITQDADEEGEGKKIVHDVSLTEYGFFFTGYSVESGRNQAGFC